MLKDLWYVDCCDSQHWIMAYSRIQALEAAHALSGHDDVNECLLWLWTDTLGLCGSTENAILTLKAMNIAINGLE